MQEGTSSSAVEPKTPESSDDEHDEVWICKRCRAYIVDGSPIGDCPFREGRKDPSTYVRPDASRVKGEGLTPKVKAKAGTVSDQVSGQDSCEVTR